MVRWEPSSVGIAFRLVAFWVLVGLTCSWHHLDRSGAEAIRSRAENPDTRTGAKENSVELPRIYLDTNYVEPKGSTVNVSAGGNLQEAINRAKSSDVVKLSSVETYIVNFLLANKGDCKAWIVIRSDVADSKLPMPGARITPSYTNVMPKVFSSNVSPAITTANGANHYRFVGVEIGVEDSVKLNYGVFTIGQSETSLSELPHDITIDRCYIHGAPKGNVKRGIAFNGASLAVVDSYISDIHVVGQDTQAILGWNGPGPFKIVNNELEAAGENIMFGGVRPTLVNNIPSDIEIRGNHIFKPLSWMVGHAGYAGIHWTVKNLLEFKIAQRVLVTGNVLENNWVDGQAGVAFLITPRTEYGTAPWVYVQDITFTYNVLRHTASAVNISGLDSGDPQKLVRGRRILIQNSLFNDVNGKTWGGGGGRLFQVISGADAVTIDHNTGFQDNPMVFADGIPNTNFVYQNNITPHNMYGVIGTGYAPGIPTPNRFFPGFVFQRNVIVNTRSKRECRSRVTSASNFFSPSDWAGVQFVDSVNRNLYPFVAIQPVQERWDGRKSHRRRHRGAQRGDLFGDRSLKRWLSMTSRGDGSERSAFMAVIFKA